MRAHAHRRPARGAAARVVIGAVVAAFLTFIVGYALGMQFGGRAAEPAPAAPVDTEALVDAIDRLLEQRLGEGAPQPSTGGSNPTTLTETDFLLINRAIRTAMQSELNQQARRERAASFRDAATGQSPPAARSASRPPADPLDQSVADAGADDAEGDWANDAPPQGPAPFTFDPPQLDFGFVAPGAVVDAPVTLTNTSERTLRIAAMRASCQCTTLEDLSGRAIAPGESITFTPQMESPTALGPKNASIRFIFEGYGRHEFAIRSVSARAVYAEPAFLAAIDETQGEFTVRSLDGDPFRVLSVNGAAPDFVDPAAADSTEPRSEYALRWDLSRFDAESCADEQGNPMPHFWVVETDHPRAPIIDLRVRSLCALPDPIGDRRWIMSRRRVLLDEINAGDGGEFTVFMEWLNNTPAQDTIRRIQSESDDFHASLLGPANVDGQQGFRVRIVPRPDFEGLLYGDVRFHAYKPGHSDTVTVIARVVPDDGEEASSAAADDGGSGEASAQEG